MHGVSRYHCDGSRCVLHRASSARVQRVGITRALLFKSVPVVAGRGDCQSFQWNDPRRIFLVIFILLFALAFDLGLFGWAPTMELSVHVRAVPAPGWLKVRHETRNIAGGLFEEDCEVWDSAGRLVAQSRQLAKLPRR